MSDINLRSEFTRALHQAILPEDRATLKLVFDNLRNFVICAGIFAAGRWLHGGGNGPEMVVFGIALPTLHLSLVIWILGALLIILNTAQSFALFHHLLFRQFMEFGDLLRKKKGAAWGGIYDCIITIFGIFGFLILLVVISVLGDYSLRGPIGNP